MKYIKSHLIIMIMAAIVTYTVNQRDVKELGRDFNRLIEKVGGVKTKDFSKAAKPYSDAIRAVAPRAKKEVKRYDTPKLSNRQRAPKGRGRIVARYAPGNAQRSFVTLRLRRVKNAAIIGPKRAKGAGAKGYFSGRRVDGYYVGMLNKKRPFVSRAWQVSRPQVIRNIRKLYEGKVKEARVS